MRVTLVGGHPTNEVLRANAALDRTLRDTARAAVAIDLLRRQPSISADEFAAAAQESEHQTLAFLKEGVRLGMLVRTANPRPGGIPAWRLADDLRSTLGPVLPYFSRPAGESILLIEQLARSQGNVRNQDVQDLLGVRPNRASQLLARALAEGRLALADGASPSDAGRPTSWPRRRATMSPDSNAPACTPLLAFRQCPFDRRMLYATAPESHGGRQRADGGRSRTERGLWRRTQSDPAAHPTRRSSRIRSADTDWQAHRAVSRLPGTVASGTMRGQRLWCSPSGCRAGSACR